MAPNLVSSLIQQQAINSAMRQGAVDNLTSTLDKMAQRKVQEELTAGGGPISAQQVMETARKWHTDPQAMLQQMDPMMKEQFAQKMRMAGGELFQMLGSGQMPDATQIMSWAQKHGMGLDEVQAAVGMVAKARQDQMAQQQARQEESKQAQGIVQDRANKAAFASAFPGSTGSIDGYVNATGPSMPSNREMARSRQYAPDLGTMKDIATEQRLQYPTSPAGRQAELDLFREKEKIKAQFSPSEQAEQVPLYERYKDAIADYRERQRQIASIMSGQDMWGDMDESKREDAIALLQAQNNALRSVLLDNGLDPRWFGEDAAPVSNQDVSKQPTVKDAPYPEGTELVDKNGNRYVVRGGEPVPLN